MTGRFIVIDGHDRSALDRHSAELVRWLRSRGVPVVSTREPSDGPVGGQLRQVLSGRLEIASLSVPLLFLADRIDHLQREGDGILAQLAAEKWVVCTRYLLSALAYQAGTAPLDWLARINAACPWPDVMAWCDSPGNGEVHDRFAEAVDYCRAAGQDVLQISETGQAALRTECARWLDGPSGETV